ncbi:MAG TPA: NnrU family protein [Casimicrobiaceae bacterium]|nr:NnrU family protein [Casimicrobiaceae bacterium]
MSVLIAGLVVFLASHSVGHAAPAWRARQIARVGLRPWKLAYSAISLAGLVLIVRGFGMARADAIVVWQSPAWTRHVTVLLTVVGFVLIAAAYVPATRIRAALGHPMTAGVALWASGHLIANGGLADVVLFGAFLVWALITFVARRRRDRDAGVVYAAGSLARDAIAIVAGIVVSLLFALYLHGPLIGVRPFG